MIVEYKTDDVLTAARKRIAYVFDRFPRIVVSVSSGKDSTTLWRLTVDEAERRNRRVTVFFLDQEAEYASSIEIVEQMMSHPLVDPMWYQIPIELTNATSHREYFLQAWWPGQEWMRARHPLAISDIAGNYPRRFYGFFQWHETTFSEPTAFLIGLRSNESFNRFRSVTSHAGFEDVAWSTRTKSPDTFRFYPLFDWTFGDVWKYIDDEGIAYNRVYDFMFAKYGQNMRNMRISNLVHEKSFHCLADLQEFEPATYERLVSRLGGVHCAALYSKDALIFDTRRLPDSFGSWRAYRDYLLETTPCNRIERFRKRFLKQADDEPTAQQQVKQLLLNDWEGTLAVNVPKDRRAGWREKWWPIL